MVGHTVKETGDQSFFSQEYREQEFTQPNRLYQTADLTSWVRIPYI